MRKVQKRPEPVIRCAWCGNDDIYQNYHDEEWGVPIYDSKELFAKLILDGAQAGLSWITILRKRDAYYAAFDNLDPDKMALFSEAKQMALMDNPGIVRNRLKIQSAVKNAKAFIKLRKDGVEFSEFLWGFVGGKPIQNRWRTMADIPTETPESQAMSKALKKAGFNFVGPTIVYAFMQAVGMVNDHVKTCHRYQPVVALSKR